VTQYLGEDVVARVKAATDLVAVMGDYTTVKRAGAHHVACCPFHQERTPSLTIYDDGRYHCFGCGADGDAIKLVQELERVDFIDAVETLARRAGIVIERKAGTGPSKGQRQSLLAAVELATAFYAGCLANDAGAAARTYLAQRGYTDATVASFRLGWAPGRGALVAHAHAAGIDPALLVTADLAVDRDGRRVDRFFDRIMWPICDRFGQPIAFSARILPEAERRAKEAGHSVGKYVNTRDTPLYRKGDGLYNLHRARSAARDAGQLLLVEAQTGVMAAHQCGMTATTAALGTALTAQQAKLLATAAGDGRLVVVFDGDAAGRDRAAKAVAELLAIGAPSSVATLPDDHDPAELLVEHADPAVGRTLFDDAIAKACDDVTYLLRTIAPDPAALRNHEVLAAADAIVAVLRRIPDPDLRDLHAQGAAKHLRLPASTLRRRMGGDEKPPEKIDLPDDTTTPAPPVPGLHDTVAQPPTGGGGDVTAPTTATEPPPERALTDWGNAERLVDRHGLDLRYVHDWGHWLIWGGTHWQIDHTQESTRRMKDTIRTTIGAEIATTTETITRLRDEVRNLESVNTRVKHSDLRRAQNAYISAQRHRKQLTRHLTTSENTSRLRAALESTQSQSGVGVAVTAINRDPWLFAVRNGVLDLRTGELRPHDRADLITRCAPIDYRRDAYSERWARFMEDLTGGDEQLEAYLQRAAGYSLTGLTREEVVFLVHGPGAAGKSTFLSALQGVIGDYAKTTDFETFLASPNPRAREQYLAALEEARLVVCSESGSGKRFAEEAIKKVTGGDAVLARRLYAEPYEYIPRWKLWLVCNDPPYVSDVDSGFWRRLQCVALTNSIPAALRDKDLKTYLREDPDTRAAVLCWMVNGALAYAREGLAPPASVLRARDAYRASNDPIADWLAERTVWRTEHSAWVSCAELALDYRTWCEHLDQKPLSQKALVKRLEARGGKRTQGRLDGRVVKHWTGVRLRRPNEDDETVPANVPPMLGAGDPPDRMTPEKSVTASVTASVTGKNADHSLRLQTDEATTHDPITIPDTNPPPATDAAVYPVTYPEMYPHKSSTDNAVPAKPENGPHARAHTGAHARTRANENLSPKKCIEKDKDSAVTGYSPAGEPTAPTRGDRLTADPSPAEDAFADDSIPDLSPPPDEPPAQGEPSW
jgi:putative DNA primase/helicase